MDHPCYKCGQIVEDGRPFCGQCGAPQIRVSMPEAAPVATAGDLSSAELPIFPESSGTLGASFKASAFSAGIVWPSAFRACAIAAVISIVVISLRLMSPLVVALGAGCLAVILYRRRNPAWTSSARSGAQLGALTNFFSSGVSAICFAFFLTVMRSGGQLSHDVMEQLQQFVARSNDPNVKATFDLLKTPDGINTLVLGMIGVFLISIVAGSIAGALTAVFIDRRSKKP